MEYVFIILALLLLLLGIAGCILPVIPGPPIAYLSLILLHFTTDMQFGIKQLWILAFLTIAIQIVDYIVPVWGTKKFGGSRSGIRGSMIGLIVGVIVLPLLGIVIGPFGLIGIVAGPFIGAYIGETLTGKPSDQAMRAATGSFIGFLTGTFMKLIITFILAFFLLKTLYQYIF